MTPQELPFLLAVIWGVIGALGSQGLAAEQSGRKINRVHSLECCGILQSTLTAEIAGKPEDPPEQPPPSNLLPDPPPTPPPPFNRVEPGGVLAPGQSSCQASDRGLRALIPVGNPVLSITDYPTLLFYVPDASAAVRVGEFSILTQDERRRIGKVRFTLPETPGIVSVRLPELPEYALAAGEEGQYYRWYLKLYCQDSPSAQADLVVDGWIGRIPSQSAWEDLVNEASPAIWYDSLARLAERLRQSPQDPELQRQWRELLQAIDAEDLVDAELVGPAIVQE